jgi:hypothetical protein
MTGELFKKTLFQCYMYILELGGGVRNNEKVVGNFATRHF